MELTIHELLAYLDEERSKWERWFSMQGNAPLKIPTGGETHPTLGALIMHCFWTELWYAYMLSGQVLTRESDVIKENINVPNDRSDAVFDFGRKARNAMNSFVARASEAVWKQVHALPPPWQKFTGSARKLTFHVLMHEIRHWAQISMAVRQNNLTPPGEHDLMFSRALE